MMEDRVQAIASLIKLGAECQDSSFRRLLADDLAHSGQSIYELIMPPGDCDRARMCALVAAMPVHKIGLVRASRIANDVRDPDRLESIEALTLRECIVADRSWELLLSLPGLKRIWMSDTTACDDVIQEFSQLARLKSLTLMDMQVTDGTVDAIAGCKRLEVLGLSGCDVSVDQVMRLGGLERLTMLDLSHNPRVDSRIVAIGETGWELMDLNVMGCNLSDQVIAKLQEAFPLASVSFV